MSIRKIINLFLLSSIILLINSCTHVPLIKKSFKWPTKSFLKYETYLYKQTCTPKDPDNLKSDCYDRVMGATGSASIIARSFEGVYILTAAHMCDRSDDLIRLKRIDQEFGPADSSVTYFEKHYVYDIDLFKYNVEVIAHDWQLDSCIVFAWGLFGPPLKVAADVPEIGEKIYNFAAPAGFMKKNMVPLFDGYYIGDWDKNTSVYTIPVIGGSSGSPIVNEDGQLVGLVYARHHAWHHIAISPKFKNLRKFIFDSIKADAERRKRKHELDANRSIIIKFNQKQ